MFYTRYQGEFLDINGNVWKVSIQRESDSPFSHIEELSFTASPLEIEWAESSQEDSLAGSCATLNLVSPGDRTYIDLYSIDINEFRLLVYCNDMLYWAGSLDTEFSEEPYSRYDGYDVKLTFSDFGVLGRIPYALSGMRTIASVLQASLSAACMPYDSIDDSMISTYAGHTRATLDTIAVQSENFFDEDGNAMSYRDVLESLLQPLGMKMIQRNGNIYVYDLNGLYTTGAVRPIEWALTDQCISSDKVFNDIRISLSTYAQKSFTPAFKYTGKYSTSQINLSNTAKPDGNYYSYYEDYGRVEGTSSWDYGNVDFTIFLGTAEGLSDVNSQAEYFHILPVLGNEESEGVAIWFYTGGHGPLTGPFPVRKGFRTVPAAGTMLMKTHKIYLPPLPEAQAMSYKLRIRLDLLLDPRYNPFTEASSDNEAKSYEQYQSVCDVLVPVKIQLYDVYGSIKSHYSNASIARSVNRVVSLSNSLGTWVNGAAAYDDCFFQWYDPEKKNAGPATLGWKANRHACGLSRNAIYDSFKKLANGQYIEYPAQGGYLEVTVCGGLTMHRHKKRENIETDRSSEYLSMARWMMFKAPVIEILKDGVVMESIDTNDVEYSGILNTSAKNTLNIETICGTMSNPNPAARGLYHMASDGTIITELTRAGRTTQAEQLLIGTLYSQFAQRRMKLTGTSALDPFGLCCRADAAQPSGRKFYTTSEVQLIREAENRIVAVELRPDEFISNNE